MILPLGIVRVNYQCTNSVKYAVAAVGSDHVSHFVRTIFMFVQSNVIVAVCVTVQPESHKDILILLDASFHAVLSDCDHQSIVPV